jgi:hypothetical protein
MVPIYIPDTPWELALVQSLLHAYGVPHFVHNYYLGALYPAFPQMHIYNLRRVYVPAEKADYARQLLADFFPDLGTTAHDMSVGDMVRVVFELLLGGWCIPGNKWPHREAA